MLSKLNRSLYSYEWYLKLFRKKNIISIFFCRPLHIFFLDFSENPISGPVSIYLWNFLEIIGFFDSEKKEIWIFFFDSNRLYSNYVSINCRTTTDLVAIAVFWENASDIRKYREKKMQSRKKTMHSRISHFSYEKYVIFQYRS